MNQLGSHTQTFIFMRWGWNGSKSHLFLHKNTHSSWVHIYVYSLINICNNSWNYSNYFCFMFQILQQFNVDLRNLCFNSLTEVTTALQLESFDLVSACRVDEISVPIISDGCISAIPVWFEYQIYNHSRLFSTFTETSHINQMVFIVDPPITVKSGDSITLHITYHCGIIRIKVLR